MFGATLLAFALALGTASASKQAVAFIPSDSGEIAVNSSGAGPADPGDVYILGRFNRIQRFATDDNGTPADPYDDTFPFVSTWGADVDATPSGGSDYEICTVEADCKLGVPSGGNGTPQGNGVLNGARSDIAVDQDTGEVYVSDRFNARINVYTGDGAFLRSFGWDVVASGLGDTGTGYEICVAAAGDVCKAGAPGAGTGQINNGRGLAVSPPDGNPLTGTVFLANTENRRVNTYTLGGSVLSSFGSAAEFANDSPEHVGVDSRGIVYISDRNNTSEVDRYDSQNANGGGVGFLASIPAPPLSTANTQRRGFEVDPDSDGPGPETDVLYLIRDGADPSDTVVQQFGPVNQPGLSAPPAAQDDQHGLLVGFAFVDGLGLDTAAGRLFVSGSPENGVGSGTYVLDTAGGAPTASLDSISDLTPTTATLHATVDPNGPPPVSYEVEYSTDGLSWTTLPGGVVGSQDDPQTVEALLDPSGTGLEPVTFYHVRLRVTKVFTPPILTNELTFTTAAAPPQLETTGAPRRTATTAELTGRVNPRGSATEYHFEYGELGSCDSNPCASTPARPAGSGQLIRLVSEQVAGLDPGTTYHYRLVADNPVTITEGSPAVGSDRTLTTRASDAPLDHGSFPGPPGSDRAWELVSAPDTSGNPVSFALAFSAAGDRAAYQIAGGTPQSSTGSLFSMLYAERPTGEHPTSGWETIPIEPPRSELIGSGWGNTGLAAASDLSSIFVWNFSCCGPEARFFRLSPGAPTRLLETVDSEGRFAVAADGSTVVASVEESHDPAHLPGTGSQVYGLSSGTPELISYLPDGSVGPCDASVPTVAHNAHAVSADGSLVYFTCSGLYVRDLGAGQTTQIAPGGSFIKSTPEAVFFVGSQSLDPADEGGNDVYRYDLAGGERSCVTCVVPGVNAEVEGGSDAIAVAADGSRVYFRSPNRLLPGTPEEGIYRVEVATGELAFVAEIGDSEIGENVLFTKAISTDGTRLVFGSDDPSLNPLGPGPTNAGSFQYYLYNDTDRSLSCVSCPPDGSPPLADVPEQIGAGTFNLANTANTSPLADDGTFAFATKTPLLPADQNTPAPGQDLEHGVDVYEWRDGRLLLVTDGLSSWPSAGPRIQGVSPSGRDVFFIATAQYTADALDDNFRLYDARIGGGIDFPVPPPPCPLEVCQGTPKGAPEDPFPASLDFRGAGNPVEEGLRPCPKGKVRRRSRCVPRRCPKGGVRRRGKCAKRHRPARHRAERNRRTGR